MPGAEPYAEWVLSARRGLLAMAEEHAGETIVAVTNAAVIMASLEIFANMPRVSATAAPPVANTPITEWALGLSVPGAAGSEPSWAVSRHNDAAHLHLSEHQKSISPGA